MPLNHTDILLELAEAQNAETDNRQRARKADHFANKENGQWEQEIITQFAGKPKYTFDETNPIIDDIMGEMASSEFSIRVLPTGSEATRDTAQIFEGIIRTIENISNATDIYLEAARIMVTTGLAGWRVVQRYRDDNSFNQDLMIDPIPGFEDSVWFDRGAKRRNMSDAEHCWALTRIPLAKYKEKYPDGSGLSVGEDRDTEVYFHKSKDDVVIGEYLYRKIKNRTLALMSDDSILVVDDKFEMIKDELALAGVTPIRFRNRPYHQVYQRLFDGADWLSTEKETAFSYLPIIPVFGNFRVSENKLIYWGIVHKLMDAQRVINYAESRKIEEGALSPRGKIWMPKDQAQSEEVRRKLRTLNTNADPVQFYDHVDGLAPPTYQGSPASNPGLIQTAQSAQSYIQRTSGTFDEARGAAPAHRSGEAIQLLQQKSDNPKRKWFQAMEVALQHTYRVMVHAIPVIYDSQQQIILTGRDGTTDMVTLRKKIVDRQTGEPIEINDLSKGNYDTICTAGPAFHSRQQETVSALIEMAKIDPSILQIGADILLYNQSAPGIDKIAERKRLQMVMAGLIPQNQMTQAEKQLLEKSQKEKEPTPLDKANLMIAEAQLLDAKGKNQERQTKLQLEQQKVKLKEIELRMKQQIEQTRIQNEQQMQMVEAVTAAVQQMKLQADTLKALREAIGVETIKSEQAMQAFNTVAGDTRQAANAMKQ